MVHFPKKYCGAIFFSSKGGLAKYHTFPGFFSDPFPNVWYNLRTTWGVLWHCQYYLMKPFKLPKQRYLYRSFLHEREIIYPSYWPWTRCFTAFENWFQAQWVLTNWRREGSCLQYLLKSHCDPQLGYQKYSNQDIHLPLPLSRWFLSLTQPTCNTKIRYMLRPIVTSVNNYWGMLVDCPNSSSRTFRGPHNLSMLTFMLRLHLNLNFFGQSSSSILLADKSLSPALPDSVLCSNQ